MDTAIKLTEYSKHGGCGCKIAPDVLTQILSGNSCSFNSAQLLVGNDSNDDAAVFDLQNGTAIISTADFFTPIVDDPYHFGRIAAANALSDVYAMGGKPLMAIAILGFPVSRIPVSVAAEIKKGAEEICAGAGIPLAGGHSIDSAEPFFGLSVTGMSACENIKRNNTAQPGDVLFLTKPLGTGIITSALRKQKVQPDDLEAAIQSMTTLNDMGAAISHLPGVHAMTDITGFGFLGHLMEVCKGSNVSAHIQFNELPVLPGCKKYISEFLYPDMTTKIFANISNDVNELTSDQLFIACDPQTSGGLLIAVGHDSVQKFKDVCAERGFNPGNPVGVAVEKEEKYISVF